MRKICSAVLSATLFLTTFAFANAATKPASVKKTPPPPDYFPLKKDYSWKYQTNASTGKSGFEQKVMDEEKQPDGTILFDVHTQPENASGMGAKGFDEWYTKPKGWVLVVRSKNGFNGQVSETTPPRKYLENPLKVGEEWSWTGTRFGNTQATENNKVDGEEEIEVPAGKFKTMRVVSQVTQGGSPMTKTYWYAPWVGLVQSKTESGSVTSTTQLVDYSFKKPEKPAE